MNLCHLIWIIPLAAAIIGIPIAACVQAIKIDEDPEGRL